ncbi:hypothetical protein JRO89_XS01G0390100 [Xanthoceras sorbifolium]|uniref:RING-type E3 ubiquitin transferase n=1 Tax=Xanthoceras sorbifolium TaxID=99658 RepID=A0ABQ8IP75_9ROSI|nr:hypothetical protein JRO89_XS01G0390100 [Xanthoceras sorbifolium]
MAQVSQLPCNGDGMCMQCRETPRDEEKLPCKTCATPWHVTCLASPPDSLVSSLQWDCPDCTGHDLYSAPAPNGLDASTAGIVAEILAIEADASLTGSEKARKRQELMSRKPGSDGGDTTKSNKGKEKVVSESENDVLDIFGESLKCSFCMQLPERPTPCGHNFCLRCFQKWIGQRKNTCAKCRSSIPAKMAKHPRINSTLVVTIRMAKMSKPTVTGGTSKGCHFVHNQDRPNEAFTTERAKRNGKANAASGKIFVTVPSDHFGPILAENDPERNQSVVLSGGYKDDEDHGEWFLYTGRSHKEKRSSYAPEKGLRYDGIYRIEECWRKVGIQGFKVCRYLFVRCDNDPAPWTSDEHGDRPRPLPVIPELDNAVDVTRRKEDPSWDYNEAVGLWKWIKPPPVSKIVAHNRSSDGKKRSRGAMAQGKTVREKLLKEFSCLICKQVLTNPVTTPCAHNFCKSCLEEAFSGKSFVRARGGAGRTLRSQKNIMKCPFCMNDIADFLKNPQVNRELMEVIESLKQKTEENDELIEESSEQTNGLDKTHDPGRTRVATETPNALDFNSEAGVPHAKIVKGGNKEMQAEEADSPLSPLLMSSDGQDSACTGGLEGTSYLLSCLFYG